MSYIRPEEGVVGSLLDPPPALDLLSSAVVAGVLELSSGRSWEPSASFCATC